MRTAILDIETSGFDAQGSIILCAVIKEYSVKGKGKVTVIRNDEFPTWKKNRSNDEPIVRAIMRELDGDRDAGLSGYDIVVAHNGEFFDKAFLTAKCIEYRIPPTLRKKKSIDPVLLSRKYMRLNRNGLGVLINFLQVPHRKTPVSLLYWRRASLEGDAESMEYIVRHCVADVKALDRVYHEVKSLVDKIDTKGSQF
jgi:uncharacterized protein YprB with RNaseH-like and TPR domain